jgi:hypothetical protein
MECYTNTPQIALRTYTCDCTDGGDDIVHLKKKNCIQLGSNSIAIFRLTGVLDFVHRPRITKLERHVLEIGSVSPFHLRVETDPISKT